MENNSPKQRLLYIDNLRLCMIILVVMVHFGVTYSGIGGWYISEQPHLDVAGTIFFGLFESFTQAYFMGFLFLISGYFTALSYHRKGVGKFITDRLIRLGIPTLIYMLVIFPFIVCVLLKEKWHIPSFWDFYRDHLFKLRFLESSGPLWFAFALLIFDIIYALCQKIKKNGNNLQARPFPGIGITLLLILVISVAAFLIRLVQPIDTSILNMQLCFFAQYIMLFIVGTVARKNDWFSKIRYGYGMKWLKAALIPGILLWFAIMLTGGVLNYGFDIFKGGMNWQSAVYAAWESFISVAMSIGLIAWFKEKYNNQNRLVRTLSDNSFAVYMFHAPIITAFSLAVESIKLYPILKFTAACIIGIPLCFAATHFVFRRIPLLKKVL